MERFEQREMHKAICADCGQECEVPFEPIEGKPVRCQDCFRKNRPRRFDNRGSGGQRRFNRGGFDRPREMHKAKCSECGQECEVPFMPKEGRPVFCRDCFRNQRSFN